VAGTRSAATILEAPIEPTPSSSSRQGLGMHPTQSVESWLSQEVPKNRSQRGLTADSENWSIFDGTNSISEEEKRRREDQDLCKGKHKFAERRLGRGDIEKCRKCGGMQRGPVSVYECSVCENVQCVNCRVAADLGDMDSLNLYDMYDMMEPLTTMEQIALEAPPKSTDDKRIEAIAEEEEEQGISLSVVSDRLTVGQGISDMNCLPSAGMNWMAAIGAPGTAASSSDAHFSEQVNTTIASSSTKKQEEEEEEEDEEPSSAAAGAGGMSWMNAIGKAGPDPGQAAAANGNRSSLLSLNSVEGKMSSNRSAKVCSLCKEMYKGFGEICGTCRKQMPDGAVQTCSTCGVLFTGFGSNCGTCES